MRTGKRANKIVREREEEEEKKKDKRLRIFHGHPTLKRMSDVKLAFGINHTLLRALQPTHDVCSIWYE